MGSVLAGGVLYKLTEAPLRKRVVGTPCGSNPSAKIYSEVPDWLDLFGLMVKGFTTLPVVAKQGLRWNFGLVARATVPAIWPGAGGALNVMVAFTVASNGEPLLAAIPSNAPVAEPDKIGGRNVAVKLPEPLLQAETFPTEEYVPLIVGIRWNKSPGTGVRGLYMPV